MALIGVPLTYDSGATPGHSNATVFGLRTKEQSFSAIRMPQPVHLFAPSFPESSARGFPLKVPLVCICDVQSAVTCHERVAALPHALHTC
jgi:hypothetical protein